MVISYKSKITFDTKANHPDEAGVKGMVFEDVYHFDTDRFYLSDPEEIEEYIQHDLSLVAGGGYETNTIENVRFDIRKV